MKITLDNISPLDILAIAAHRDDVEQTCGGTLLRMAQRGQRTGILDLTQGEMGTRGTAEERAQEAAEAARILRVSWRQALDIPDGRVENSFENRLKVARVIREQRPRVVILPYWEGRHPDHYTASTLGYEACFLAGLAKLDVSVARAPSPCLLYTSLGARRGGWRVKCQMQWLCRSQSTLTKPTNGITGRCTWKFSTTCGGKTCMPRPPSMPWLGFLGDTELKPAIS